MASYKYSLEVKYVKTETNEAVTFEPHNVIGLIVERNYEEDNMAQLFLIIAIDKVLKEQMIDAQTKNLINLAVYKVSDNPNTPDYKELYFKDQFTYILDPKEKGSNELDYQQAEEEDEEIDTVCLGLVSVTCMNNNKHKSTIWQIIFHNTSVIDLVHTFTKHMPMVIEPFVYNGVLSTVIVPHMDSVSLRIAYINNEISTFYDSPYRYFIDFDRTYLLSCSGRGTPVKGEKINSVIIDIHSKSDVNTLDKDVVVNDEGTAYVVTISTDVDCEIARNFVTEKIYNQISTVTAEGEEETTDLEVNPSGYSDVKARYYRVPNNNNNLIKNIKAGIENASTTIEINRNNMDASIFTPNKQYTVKDTADNKVSGTYILAASREIYTKSDAPYFLLNLTLLLKSVK